MKQQNIYKKRLWRKKTIQLNKGDIIKDGENFFSIFCVMCSVIYVKKVSNVNSTPYPHCELEEVLKHYRKIEIVGDKANDE